MFFYFFTFLVKPSKVNLDSSVGKFSGESLAWKGEDYHPRLAVVAFPVAGEMIFTLFFFKSLTEKNLRLTETITRMSIVSCRVTQQVYSIFDSKRARHSSAWPLNGCVAPRLVAKIRSALPYLAQLAKGGSRPTAALEKSMIDTTTAMPQVGDSGLQGDVFHKSHKKTTCIL